ncbi:hypothetical protein LNAOJCKE_0423 [Methylorubrum aminovorans]|uniref:Uncharacterized protein n=1 Tax=Methylorubrum aminovorans TaxID=269069 RepID=A0ABQ4U8D3_9HYPH|nr:hypothetical protein [Methylorubrum aminovorans]GJE63229.1 hypothetical protein LNAOJCKE_0423 [Methylorubrum aminovorans]GMA79274.1 hypothetical protein GCM10025880_56910 [Methylorubrum aminovorans]
MPLYLPSSGATTPTATTAQYIANTAGVVLSPDAVWGSGVEAAPGFITSFAPALDLYINARLTLTANFTLANPAVMKPGQSGRIRLIQDATGGRTIAYGSYWKKAAGDPSALSTAAGAVDILYYDVIDSTTIKYTLSKGIA